VHVTLRRVCTCARICAFDLFVLSRWDEGGEVQLVSFVLVAGRGVYFFLVKGEIGGLSVSFFLYFVTKIQMNHWTQWMVRTQLVI